MEEAERVEEEAAPAAGRGRVMEEEAREAIQRLLEKIQVWPSILPERQGIVTAHFLLDEIEYLVTPKFGAEGSAPRQQIGNPICSAPACPAGWRAGLVNQALPGYDPVWYCEKHAPEYRANGVSAPPGSPVPLGPRLQEARKMAPLWQGWLAELEATEATSEAEEPAETTGSEDNQKELPL